MRRGGPYSVARGADLIVIQHMVRQLGLMGGGHAGWSLVSTRADTIETKVCA